MKNLNRYVVAVSGVVLHLMLGSTYAWSVFRNPIISETGWDISSVSFAFSLAIFCLGMSAAFMGHLVERFGPRIMGMISAILYGAGNVLTGLAIETQQLWLLYVAYGILGGIGLGSGYITPVSTIIKWFPDRRGLATGFAIMIMGFGFASLVTSPLAQSLMIRIGVGKTFYILGLVYFFVMMIASQFIKQPPQEKITILTHDGKKNAMNSQIITGLKANAAIKSKTFYIIWLTLFINISCGLGLISAASPMAQDLAGYSAESAALLVGVLGIFNGFGRLLWASLSDYIGRPLTFIILFIVNFIMTSSLFLSFNAIVFAIAMSILMTCYGAGFSLLPAYLSDIFGTKELATLHGYSLTAWAIAGLFGPLLLSKTYSWGNSYQLTLMVFGFLFLFGLLLSLYLRKLTTKVV
ncbi:TPA: OFA family MFS transporter [Streptococcus agalactiae]